MENPPPENAKNTEAIRKLVIETIKTVYDPEIPVDIYELGLIYSIDISPDGKVDIKMTLTSPACPVAEILPVEVDRKTRSIDGVTDVNVELVWDPPWSPERMSEAARLELNM
ncbi:MAG: SUF system Fe-S cluster assembly protein [Candidatus Latescibacterota bacterium]|nr:MAG: SUF system Fe-S cluster assembly protein [Candidatus Latescibacterota bacterium]